MRCKIIKDKVSGEEFLIPGCSSVVHNWSNEGMTDREIIKSYCSCTTPKVEKYEIHTRDEVKEMIAKLEAQMGAHKEQLSRMEEELDMLKSEVLFLNTVEIS